MGDTWDTKDLGPFADHNSHNEARIDDINTKLTGAATGRWLGTNEHNWINELAKLEKKRIALHEYLIMKLDERDYHGIADAAMDLRELDARSKAIKEWVDSK